jgi:hypothetical protein
MPLPSRKTPQCVQHLILQERRFPRHKSMPQDKHCGAFKKQPGLTLLPHSGQNVLMALEALRPQAGQIGPNRKL